MRPGADQLFSTSVDGWYTGTPTDVIMEPDRGALLAVGMNGEALPPEHGFPVRMVVPGPVRLRLRHQVDHRYRADHVRRQAGLLARSAAGRSGPRSRPRAGSTIPRGFATVPAGRLTVAGIAWAQHTGIGAVEVRMDGGPWQRRRARRTEVNRDTWRMWRARFDVGPGSHTVQTRAVDARGVGADRSPRRSHSGRCVRLAGH